MTTAPEMALDLTLDEVVAVYALARLGMAAMANNVPAGRQAMSAILDHDIDPDVADKAMRKLRGGLTVAASVLDGGVA